jgi:membrane protease YdiL (CAAX protease family)
MKISFVTGFVILFLIYHFPEFFSAFWIAAVCKILFLITAFIVAKAQGYKGLSSWGLPLHKGWWKNLLYGLLIGVAIYMISTFISIQMKFEAITSLPSFITVIEQLPMILLITSVPSVAEDILTRGYFYKHLKQHLKPFIWILVSAAAFYLNHIWRYSDGIAVFAYLLIMGLLLAYTVVKTNSLWLAFGLHWGFNSGYQSTASLISVDDISKHKESTWIFALCLLLLLLILLMFQRTKLFCFNNDSQL